MSMKRTVLAAVAALALLVAVPTAQAAPKKYCVSDNHGAYVCFQPYDDVLWVKDTRRDGYAVSLVYETSYGRKGQCTNVEGKGVNTFCDLDMREGQRIRFWAVKILKTTSGDSYRFWSTDRQTII